MHRAGRGRLPTRSRRSVSTAVPARNTVDFTASAELLRALKNVVGRPGVRDPLTTSPVAPSSSGGGGPVLVSGEVHESCAIPSGWRVVDEIAPFTDADFERVPEGGRLPWMSS